MDQRQEEKAGEFRQLVEQILHTNTHDDHAVQHLLDQALHPC